MSSPHAAAEADFISHADAACLKACPDTNLAPETNLQGMP